MKKRISILIVDDHPIFRRGLRDILQSEKEILIIDDVGDGISALEVLKRQPVEVVILDLEMPLMNGFEFIQTIRSQHVQVEIIILTMHKERDLFIRAMELGIRGFVNKENAALDIVNCIRAVTKGNSYGCPVNQRGQSEKSGTIQSHNSVLATLTTTERKVLKLIAENKSSVQIAQELFISPKTVDNHRTNICSKLDLHGSHALLRFLLENKSFL